jgi:phosphatidylglycerophosphatase A
MKSRLHYWFSTVLGAGYVPKAPGTAGSLAAILFFGLIPLSVFFQIGLLIILFFAGVYSSAYVEKLEGTDPGLVVIDEFVGQGIAVLFIPKTILFYGAAFILFRIFDIFKPLWINRIQDLPRGWGIMTDDLLAGVYANILIQVFIYSGF